ncbi:hypothetical protein J5N97_013289 [Dioscorea zingiberensis]|uniref:Uncharacterized protein n=1 Tax=Dioscorea zingiberensis TaxID=325984 RepID=A0A9D5CT27_9LILI|nr:hypothetical protein J5N97_013289 [Dioscorea zingiberensis]
MSFIAATAKEPSSVTIGRDWLLVSGLLLEFPHVDSFTLPIQVHRSLSRQSLGPSMVNMPMVRRLAISNLGKFATTVEPNHLKTDIVSI